VQHVASNYKATNLAADFSETFVIKSPLLPNENGYHIYVCLAGDLVV
jgi:hypothetical protein